MVSMKFSSPLNLAAAFVLMLAWTTSTAVACPTCKEGLGNSSHLVNGYGWSIIFMMSAPFLILAGLASYFYYEIRKARAAAQSMAVSDSVSTAVTS